VIVDAHHHVWDPAAREHEWLASLPSLRRRFSVADYVSASAPHGVTASVLVQVLASTEETEDFLMLADAGGPVAGVVGWVDLTSPHVGDDIAALRRAPGGRFLLGVRHMLQDEPDPAWLERADVARGLAVLAEHGLVYDLLTKPRELPTCLAVARRFRQLRFVLDHIGKPPIASGAREPWASRIAPFADLPNVTCKLSGMVTEADWQRWQAADLQPYLDAMVGWFGEDRLLFGSDWPVCLLAADYGRVKLVLEDLLEPMPPERRAKIFGANAAAIYRIAE
jgi:L-fuconolactonase